jgi:hypothetical protein
MVLISSFVVKPGLAHAGSTAAGTDGRAVALIIFNTLEKLDGRELRQIVNQATPGNATATAVDENTPFMS